MSVPRKKRRCAGCSCHALKLVRAVIVQSESRPRMGLVCKVCASCGVLVVPASLRILPAKPRKVSRGDFTRSVLAQAGKLEDEEP